MPTCKYPVALWNDLAGNVCACTVAGISVHAVALTDEEAVDQIKRYLVWYYKQNPEDTKPDVRDLQIETMTVALRPTNIVHREHYPAEDTISISFQYVWGLRSDQSVLCSVPTLGRTFHCSHPKSLRLLVHDDIISSFRYAGTSDIALAIPPGELRLDWAFVRVPSERKNSHAFVPPLEALLEVAVSLDDRSMRRQFPPAWGRSEEIRSLKYQLGKTSANLLLVGESGVGKTTLLAEAVRQLQREQTADEDSDKTRSRQRFWLTNGSRLIAGMQYLGQWEQRVEQVINELAEIQGVLCIENLLQLVQTGSTEPAASIASFLRWFLINNELRVVAECHQRELDAIRRLLPGFDSLFIIVQVPSMTSTNTRIVLDSIAQQFLQNNKVTVDERAADVCQQMFRRFLPYDGFPGKCAIFWKKLLSTQATAKKQRIEVDQVISAFVEQTGLPEFMVRDEISLIANDVEDQFKSNIIGQEDACKAAVQLILNFKSGMNDPHRPIGVHLYCGPTGVGKTELAKTLAGYLFGAGRNDPGNAMEDRLIRLDMSEYATPGSAERLLTDPTGRPSPLVQKIRQNPFVVLLFDEIEKAHAEVFDSLMNVFDEGRMMDRWGREANFCSSVIVLTSNLGASNTDPIGFDRDFSSGYETEIQKFFRPEFFNRLDKVVTFHPLDLSSIRQIAEKEILSLQNREGLKERNLHLRCSPELATWVAQLGYDRRLGARPLQRTIEDKIVLPLARWLTEHPQVHSTELKLELDGEEMAVIGAHGTE